MKNLSTGTGLALLAAAVLAYPMVNNLVPSANASSVTAATSAICASAAAQAGPTIVWYGTDVIEQTTSPGGFACAVVWRAWSDGRLEAMTTRRQFTRYVSGQGNFDTWCAPEAFCSTGWVVISDAAQGLTFRSDINFDEQVNGADLAALLNDWGDAPRHDIPPSNCPLNLVNP